MTWVRKGRRRERKDPEVAVAGTRHNRFTARKGCPEIDDWYRLGRSGRSGQDKRSFFCAFPGRGKVG